MKFLKITMILATLFFASCATKEVIFDSTKPSIAKKIEDNPKSVILEEGEFTPISGGFDMGVGATILTKQGEFNISQSGISGNILIDQRGK